METREFLVAQLETKETEVATIRAKIEAKDQEADALALSSVAGLCREDYDKAKWYLSIEKRPDVAERLAALIRAVDDADDNARRALAAQRLATGGTMTARVPGAYWP